MCLIDLIDPKSDGLLEALFVLTLFSLWSSAISFERAFICLRILIILMSLMSLTVLVPSLAALDALDICEMLAAFFPPPVMNWLIQMRSKVMVRVEMRSSQK